MKYTHPCMWEGQLTDIQQSAANRIAQAIRSNEKELLVWAVCGSGKTEMLFPGLTAALQLGKRICVATPRADVVRELLPRLQKAFPSVPIQALYGGSRDKDGTTQLIITTTHQLMRFKQAFDVVIIDEIDAFPYHADPSLPLATTRAQKQLHTIIYLTATPRPELHRRIKLNQLPHLFVPVRFHGKPLPVPTCKMCFSLKKDLYKGALPKSFIHWLKERENQQRQLLVFVPTIELANQMLESLATVLIKENIIRSKQAIAAVHAEDTDREEKVAAFRKNQLVALLTTTILERGVTFPSIDVAVIQADHEVFDESALVQIAGRAGRSADDPKGEVIYFHQGKTTAITGSIRSIRSMNKRGGFV
ncbi:DEAD/DEAH box helicase [Virgibacillus sp. W0181]|uniref:DEAD/DEAH box helicase n=1 Tax=Virgibacillus sp. W0181 TaxID=3391581 RepID=UPI003F47FE22